MIGQLVFQAQLALITEATSAFSRFDVRTIEFAWMASIVVMLVIGGSDFTAAARSAWARVRWPQRAGMWETVVVGSIVTIFATLVVVGWRNPPSNMDSMVYHLPRAMQWIQNGSVAHFATHYLAQIELGPLHEFNLAHVHLLSGGTDRFDGYVQLVALAIAVIGASELARLLGAERSGQLLAALVCATIPSAILEATSTQNNLFAASLGIGILLLLLTWRSTTGTLPRAALLGCGLGLAGLAKGTLPILIAPACVVLGLRVIGRDWPVGRELSGRFVESLIVVAACTAILVAPFFGRNYALFGNITGPVSRSTVSRDLTLKAAAGNVLRSTAANFMVGNGRDGLSAAVSRTVLQSLERVWAPLGIRPEDDRYFLGWDFDAFKIQDYTVRARQEAFGANPLHVVLICWAMSYLIVASLRRRDLRVAALLAISVACGFLLFSGAMRWNVFAVRYHVPLFVVSSALIAVSFERHRIVGRVVGFVLVVACLPQLLDNHARSLLHPRYPFPTPLAAYFRAGDETAKAYEDATDALARSRCHNLGIANWVLAEYPLWAGLRENRWNGRIAHVNVKNESSRLADVNFRPCAQVSEVTPGSPSQEAGQWTFRLGKIGLAIDPSALQP